MIVAAWIIFMRSSTAVYKKTPADTRSVRMSKADALQELSSITNANHAAYARACGGVTWNVGDHPAARNAKQSFKWSKLAWMRDALRLHPEVKYVLWADADSFFVRAQCPSDWMPLDADVGLAHDGTRRLNSGIFIVRRNPAAIEFVQRVWGEINSAGRCGEGDQLSIVRAFRHVTNATPCMSRSHSSSRYTPACNRRCSHLGEKGCTLNQCWTRQARPYVLPHDFNTFPNTTVAGAELQVLPHEQVAVGLLRRRSREYGVRVALFP